MKGRRVPTVQDVIAAANRVEPLTREALRRTLETLPPPSAPYPFVLPAEYEYMPEPSPYERGVLERYQDGRGRKS